MMERISKVQQLVDELRFVEAQKEAEYLLIEADRSIRPKLLELYLKALQNLSRSIPANFIVEYVELTRLSNVNLAQEWIEKISEKEKSRFYKRIMVQSALVSEVKGQLNKLYDQITSLQLRAYQRKSLKIPAVIEELQERYFNSDFPMELRRVSLILLLGDIENAERKIKGLILSCFEKATRKSIDEKLTAIQEVLSLIQQSSRLDIYHNLCRLISGGIKEKRDYKNLNEMIIFFDDFKMQCLVLSLINKYLDENVSRSYAEVIKQNKEYDFVYLDKYFKELKSYFVNLKENKEPVSGVMEKSPELIETSQKVLIKPEGRLKNHDKSEEEVMIANLLEVQLFSINDLLELATGFLQSDLPWAALKASDSIIVRSKNDSEILKANYIKLTSLLKLGEFRLALDTIFQSLEKIQNPEDMLSFLYCQSEAHYCLGEYQKAKQVLRKIIQIDSEYRMAKEKLEALDEF